MEPTLSVIICTHNPRLDYLYRVLEALKAQTLPIEQWELLLIDNASDQLLSSKIDLSWHSNGRHLREEQLGKNYALLLGTQEAVGEVLTIVDDDNVLDADYLEVALRIGKEWSILGAWGGQNKPGFEKTPSDWTKFYWWLLAIREFDQDSWSNFPLSYLTAPVGAGMCVRKGVAQKYFELVQSNPKRIALGRQGKKLISSEDIDMAFTSCDVGLGTGVFVSLRLTHLIPINRLEEHYLLRLAEGIAYSNITVEYFRGKIPTLPRFSWFITILKYIYYNFVLRDSRTWRFDRAFARGKALAIQELINN